MIHMQDVKFVKVLNAQAMGTDGTELSGSVDCQGFAYATLVISQGAGTNPLTTCSLAESETGGATNPSNFTAIAAYEMATFPATSAGSDQYIVYNVDVRKRKRYLLVGLACAANSICSCVAILSRAKVHPDTDALSGVADMVTA